KIRIVRSQVSTIGIVYGKSEDFRDFGKRLHVISAVQELGERLFKFIVTGHEVENALPRLINRTRPWERRSRRARSIRSEQWRVLLCDCFSKQRLLESLDADIMRHVGTHGFDCSLILKVDSLPKRFALKEFTYLWGYRCKL